MRAERIKNGINYRQFWEHELEKIKSRSGVNWTACSPLREDSHPSFSACVEGDKAGCWFDFATGDKGDVISFVMQKYGGDFKGALRYLKKNYL